MGADTALGHWFSNRAVVSSAGHCLLTVLSFITEGERAAGASTWWVEAREHPAVGKMVSATTNNENNDCQPHSQVESAEVENPRSRRFWNFLGAGGNELQVGKVPWAEGW